ncbi:WD repeat-containing protein RUP2-like [Macadamia integrifolia]|uniref:WD repeat-containing protein RUP2-like n=1 Tax=Macadamia integrifolia TaxID=60698 RepID=UPI001C4FAA47|nr:WD repeat-containing protein RUP2-like [Macadamia integrifolia]
MRNNTTTELLHPIQIQPQEHQKQHTEAKAEAEAEKAKAEEEEEPLHEWDFKLSTVVSSRTNVGVVSDTLGVIEFDPSDRLLATGGIARKIRIYSLDSLLPHDIHQGAQDTIFLDHTGSCDFYICTPAKLSSLRWKPDTCSRVVGSGDYDGVVTEYDLDRRVPIFERDEHGGRRVWSVDYSHWVPSLGASGSDDGTTQMWDTRFCGNGTCVAVTQPSSSRSSVCSVEFEPCGGPLVGVGCADRRAYIYDVRKMLEPLMVLKGHQKTVTYVRFVGEGKMVSAGTDGCLKLWDMEGARVIRTYRGHVNSRSFVGLSAWMKGGLLGCGSESNEVFVYDKRWGKPVWVRGFEGEKREKGGGFVSSVCWRQRGKDKDKDKDECMLVAGGSDGVLQVFVGKRKLSSSSSSSSSSSFSSSVNG